MIEYDLHSLYGHMMAEVTNEFLTNNTEYFRADARPFYLTRSTFAGTGKYASYSMTNQWRSWDYLKFQITGVMNMNLFGIPHSGSDACGFFGSDNDKLDEELCLRWI